MAEMEQCPRCGGRGVEYGGGPDGEGNKVECLKCDGKGVVERKCFRCGATEALLMDRDDWICQSCEFKREQAQVEAERFERQDDYNVFEENQIMLDNEAGEVWDDE